MSHTPSEPTIDQVIADVKSGACGCRCLRLLAEVERLRAVNADLLDACKRASTRMVTAGLDWLGKGPDPIEAAIAKAEEGQ
jgi:hypothetical protein